MSANAITAAEQAAAIAFVQKVQFLPYRADAVWPYAVTCWMLATAAERELAGRELPFVNADPNDLRATLRLVKEVQVFYRQEWEQVTAPGHLDIVLMSHHQLPHHIGVWRELDGGMVLHATGPTVKDGPPSHKPGVTCDTLEALRASGWRNFTFLRHRGEA